MIEVINLCAGYGAKNDVIHNINFSAAAGEFLCILGPNGCGKSTLLKSIARIIEFRGNVIINGRDTGSFSRMGSRWVSRSFSRRELAKKIALLEQSAQVFFPFTVYETVSMSRYAWSKGFLKNLSEEDKIIIEETIVKLDIEDIRDRMINELSGGQLQRVFLARTLAQTPDVLLLDEPANHLDLKYQIELLSFIKKWAKENNKILIGVFHDLNMARFFGDTALLMKNGTVYAHGKIENILNKETLQSVYSADIHGFMSNSLKKWK